MKLPFDLTAIDRVTFFKRDEVITDLICCDIDVGGQTWFFHEEAAEWDDLIRQLETLPGFRPDWFAAVSKPSFALCKTLAYGRV